MTPLPPADLRARVLEAARGARAPGRPVPEPSPIAPVEAYRRAADAFSALLDTLEPGAWRMPVLRDLDVQGLVGHLAGVEDDVRRALAGDASVADADHVASTQPSALAQAGRAPEATSETFRTAVERLLDAVRAAQPGTPVAVHGLRLPLEALLVVRTFELWTHENDIRAAVGLPATVPDAATLRLMTDLAVHALPLGVALAGGLAHPAGLHLVLTGAGGGTWDLPLGEGPPRGELLLVTDAVGFCRLVADRVTQDDLELHLDGEVALAGRVLAGAAALALD